MKQDINKKLLRRRITWLFILMMLVGYVQVSFSQTGLESINYTAESKFQPTIKDAVKFQDLPEIKDSVKRIQNIKYGITSRPIFPKYEVQKIDAAKLQNEPLQKLYHAMLKGGYSPFYNMPYGEFWIGSTRDREHNYGAHLRHLSSTTHLENTGYGGFSDNTADVFAKQYFKKHTLTGDFKYDRNVVHYYGYDTSANKISDNAYTRQRYQLFEPTVRLLSHYTDSTHINHDIKLGYYNLQNLHREAENNIRLNAFGSMFINKEKLNLGLVVDHYNHKQAKDTLNDLMVHLSPSFSAKGKKWNAEVGLTGTIDNFKGATRFYFYPKLNMQYDIYDGVIIPYAGIGGGLVKNSFRRLSTENPFIDTTINYVNTNNKYSFFGGLKGSLSSRTSYDAGVSYGMYDSLHFYAIDYTTNVQMFNRFKVIYDNTSVLNVSGQIKYQLKDKITVFARANYFLYQTDVLDRAWHKPDFDMTFGGVYNLQNKIILKADLYVMGTQWALTPTDGKNTSVLGTSQIKGWADLNLEAEYRYSKMLGFFARFNNIANQRYYRWDRYPSQKFSFMVGLSFIPF